MKTTEQVVAELQGEVERLKVEVEVWNRKFQWAAGELENAQWGNGGRCPSCGRSEHAGHHEDCHLGAVLKEAAQ